MPKALGSSEGTVKMKIKKQPSQPFLLRPYQVLCVFCAVGRGRKPADPILRRFVDLVRKNPDMPLKLVCNAGDVYAYQDPGPAADTPGGPEFNRKRDLDILQRMDWPPGVTLPARTLLKAIHKHIPSVAGICDYDGVTSEAWKGCPMARSGAYAKGCQKGLAVLLPPRRKMEMARDKQASIRAMNNARVVKIRPHILLCAVCQYGCGVRPPYADDNLPELLDMILNKKPDVLIQMVRQADWMMCAPCPNRAPKLNACVNVLGSGGLSNEKRDLDLLQLLGLTYGSTMKARDLFRLIFRKVPTTQAVCKRDNRCPSVWWDGCGESNLKMGNPAYAKGRRKLMKKLAAG